MVGYLLAPYLRAARSLAGPAAVGFVIVETAALLQEGYLHAIMQYAGIYVVSFVLVGAVDSLLAALRGDK